MKTKEIKERINELEIELESASTLRTIEIEEEMRALALKLIFKEMASKKLGLLKNNK